MTRHESIRERLHDLVDGGLGAVERREVERHLTTCGACREEVEFIRALKERAAALPREVAPARDLWGGIAGRLEPRSGEHDAPVVPIERARRRFAPPVRRTWLAAAVVAGLLIAGSSAVTAILLRGTGGVPTVAQAPVADPSAEQERPLSALVAFAPMEREYLGALVELEAEMEARRATLSPETVAVVEENLRIIDEAIVEIRSALRADSTSVELPLRLGNIYRTKVELLQSAVRLNVQS